MPNAKKISRWSFILIIVAVRLYYNCAYDSITFIYPTDSALAVTTKTTKPSHNKSGTY